MIAPVHTDWPLSRCNEGNHLNPKSTILLNLQFETWAALVSDHESRVKRSDRKHLRTREQKRRRETYQREPTVEAAESSRGETKQKKELIRAAELHVSSSRLIGRRAAGVPRRRSSEVESPPTPASEQKSYLCRGTIRPACKLLHCRQHAILIQQ